MAQSGYHRRAEPCPLSEVKQTSLFDCVMSAYDPKRTWLLGVPERKLWNIGSSPQSAAPYRGMLPAVHEARPMHDAPCARRHPTTYGMQSSGVVSFSPDPPPDVLLRLDYGGGKRRGIVTSQH